MDTKVVAVQPDGTAHTVEVTCYVMEDHCPFNGTDVKHSHFYCSVCGEQGGTTATEEDYEILYCCWCGVGG